MTGRRFSPPEATAIGFTSRVVPGGRKGVLEEAISVAKVMASKSPVAVTSTKRLMIRKFALSRDLHITGCHVSPFRRCERSFRARGSRFYSGMEHVSACRGHLLMNPESSSSSHLSLNRSMLQSEVRESSFIWTPLRCTEIVPAPYRTPQRPCKPRCKSGSPTSITYRDSLGLNGTSQTTQRRETEQQSFEAVVVVIIIWPLAIV